MVMVGRSVTCGPLSGGRPRQIKTLGPPAPSARPSARPVRRFVRPSVRTSIRASVRPSREPTFRVERGPSGSVPSAARFRCPFVKRPIRCRTPILQTRGPNGSFLYRVRVKAMFVPPLVDHRWFSATYVQLTPVTKFNFVTAARPFVAPRETRGSRVVERR